MWCMKPHSPGATRCGLSIGPRPPATRSRLCLSPCRAQTSPSGALPSARPRAGRSCHPRMCGGATSAASTTCPGWLRADVTTVYDNTEKNRTVVARVEGGDFTLRRLDATNDLHVRIAQAIKAGLSDRADPARPIARQTRGRVQTPRRADAIASAHGDASETLAPEAT